MPQGRVAVVVSPGSSPGSASWVFVVGRHFLVAVPVGTAPDIVEQLTGRITDREVDLETIVALLPLTGPSAVESFLVVVPRKAIDSDGIPISAVVRGTVAGDVFSIGGSRRFSDRGIRPWLLADFRAVTGLVIGSIDAPVPAAPALAAGHRVGTGAVAGNALVWSLPDDTGDGTVDDSTDDFADGSVGDTADSTFARHRGASASSGEPASDYDTVIRAPRALADADTVLRPPVDARPLEHDTVIRPPHPARHGRAASIDADDIDARADIDLQADTDHTLTGQHAGSAEVPAVRHVFRLLTGEPYQLDRAYVLGRNPHLPRIVIGKPPTLLTVPSATSAVSSTHLEIRPEGDSIVVTDLGSTNGSVVRPPRGRSRRLRSGQSLAVTPGTVVDIGDGNIVEILR